MAIHHHHHQQQGASVEPREDDWEQTQAALARLQAMWNDPLALLRRAYWLLERPPSD